MRNPSHAFLITRMREAMSLPEITYADITTANLRRFKDYMQPLVTPNSLFTYFAVIKATLSEMISDGVIQNPKCLSVLKVKKTPSQHCALTEEELMRLDEYEPRSVTERDAKILFMRGAYSGARSCDCAVMDMENVADDGTLTYVSKKTKTGVTQPLHKRLQKYLLMQPSKAHSRSSINYTLQAMCRKLGMTEPVTLSRNGQMVTKPKYEWVTMHSSRRSYCTSLAVRGVAPEIISKLAGHSNVTMTSSRYICIDTRRVGSKAMGFFNN